MKPSDRYSVSLCTGSHALQHQFGQLTIWRVLPIDAQRVFPNPILQGFRRDNLIALAHHRLTPLDDERLQSIEFTNCLDDEPVVHVCEPDPSFTVLADLGMASVEPLSGSLDCLPHFG